jgi:hypothetical protein
MQKKGIKIEMANINEIAVKTQKAKVDIDNFNNEVAKIQSLAKTQSIKGDGIISALENILDDYNTLSADFKKLGIDPQSYPETKNAKDIYYNYYNGVKQLTQELKNIL